MIVVLIVVFVLRARKPQAMEEYPDLSDTSVPF